jgi:hypothetical protein
MATTPDKSMLFARVPSRLKKFVDLYATRNGVAKQDATAAVLAAGIEALRSNPPEGVNVPPAPGRKKAAAPVES